MTETPIITAIPITASSVTSTTTTVTTTTTTTMTPTVATGSTMLSMAVKSICEQFSDQNKKSDNIIPPSLIDLEIPNVEEDLSSVYSREEGELSSEVDEEVQQYLTKPGSREPKEESLVDWLNHRMRSKEKDHLRCPILSRLDERKQAREPQEKKGAGTEGRKPQDRRKKGDRERRYKESTRKEIEQTEDESEDSDEEEEDDDDESEPGDSSSEEEEDMGFLNIKLAKKNGRRKSGRRECGKRYSRASKSLKTWGIKFAGDGKDDPQEYLDDLAACKKSDKLEDDEILDALYATFSGEAKIWYRNEQHCIEDYREFRSAFKKRYLKVATQDRLEEDLRGRRQGQDEDIDTFISCIKRILSEFKHPPKLHRQIKIVFKNLRPDYRQYIVGKQISKLDDLVKWGRQYEKLEDWKNEYEPPRPAEKMVVKSAAYRPKKPVGKVAAVIEEQKVEANQQEEKLSKEGGKGKKKGKKKVDQEEQVAAAQEQGRPRQEPRGKQTPTQFQAPFPRAPWPPLINPYQGLAAPHTAMAPIEKEATSQGAMYKAQQQTPKAHVQAKVPVETPTEECYICRELGHRFYNCPTRSCYICNQPGHMANRCPERAKKKATAKENPLAYCIGCGAVGIFAANCPTCAPWLKKLGNEAMGGPGPQPPL